MSKSNSSFDYSSLLSDLIKNIADTTTQLQHQHFFSEDLAAIFDPSKLNSADSIKMVYEVWIPMLLEYQSLFNSIILNTFSTEDTKESSTKKDKRFSDKLWTSHPIFNFLAQSHLIMEKYAKKFVSLTTESNENKKSVNKLHYLTDQMMGALSPSNFLFSNPVLLRELILTNGKSLLQGLKNLERDLKKNPDHLKVPMVNQEHYKIGENLATTPGKVVFQNDLIQLIQYEPQTKKVYETPLLFVSAIINKFYILDLNAENSLIEWMVKKGYTVFSISWVNPDASFADKEFSDYILNGPVAAINIIKKITKAPEINIAGYCIGGTMVACAIAYLIAHNDHSVKSVTYLTTMLDFENFGFFTDFVEEDTVKKINTLMKKQGYLDGYYLHQLFNFLRPNDLVWPYYVQNYLLGNTPGENDLLFWNSDYTNIPRKVMSYCLKNFVMRNQLIKSNFLKINNTPIDLHSIDIPAYFFSTARDHLTPWKSTYAGLQLHSGKTTFILGDSGHIAGVVNPPNKQKYGYFVNTGTHSTPDEFLKNAENVPGSWWPHWEKWLKSYSGKKVSPRKPGSAEFPVLENAPGSYVKGTPGTKS